MSEVIKISLAQVSSTAAAIRSLNQMMYESLTTMKTNMNSLNGSWISDAGETIRSRFNAFATRFDSQKEIIDSYAKFLDLTVASYDSLETSINANASSFTV